MPDKSEQEKREKLNAFRELKVINADLEKLVVRLSSVQALNEASYLRKAVVEIKKVMRTL
jgi:hypothetical protein